MTDHIHGPWRKGPYRSVFDSKGIEVCTVDRGWIEEADARCALIAKAPEMQARIAELEEEIKKLKQPASQRGYVRST